MGWFGASKTERTKPLVLHIDDSETVLLVAQSMLEGLGVDVVHAMSGKEGIRTALDKNPDLILLDAMMPEMDGYDTCRLLRSNEKTKNTPIVMVTGMDTVKDVDRALENGANGYILKPLQPDRLKAKLGEWIKFPAVEGQ